MKRFEFVFLSKDDDFKIDRQYSQRITNKYPEVNFNYISNNKDSIAFNYNHFINKYRQSKDIDYLVLMHADVYLDIEKLIQHVLLVEGKYDVIGLCGCKKINISKSPLNWFTGSSDFVNERYGCVSHGELGNNVTFFNSHSPFIADTKVACIDGLCIILTKKVIEETDLLFDERFKFDHYDTDFSFECTLKRKLNLGVIVRDDLMHWSVGKSILTQSFLESEKHFREKWQLQVN